MIDAPVFSPHVDELATAVVVIDDSARIHYVNAAAEHLLNTPKKQLLGHSLWEALGPSSSLQDALDTVRRSGWFFQRSDVPLVRRSGETWRADVTICPRFEQPGFYLLELRASDQRHATAESEYRHRMQQATQALARAIAHEIKNPLGGIRGAAQLLAMELEGSPLAEYASVIVREADRLNGLLARLIRHQRPHPVPCELHEPIEQARQVVAAEFPGVTFARDYDLSLPPLLLDRERIVQVFLNLIRNAAQALDGGGTITLRTRVQRHAVLGKKRWRLAARAEVIDHGPGIPPALREHLFFPLVSGRADGTGLGLAIAQEIVFEHQGNIEFTSEPGHTVFAVLLPIPETLPEPLPAAETHP